MNVEIFLLHKSSLKHGTRSTTSNVTQRFLYVLRSFLFTQKKEKVHFINGIVFTARKRSLRRLCFHMRLSGHRGALGLCPGGLSLGGLCPGEGVSVQGRGSLSRGGGLCPGEGGLCPGEGGLCPGKGSLSGGMGSLSGGSLSGGSLSRGSLFRGVSVQGSLCQGSSLSR